MWSGPGHSDQLHGLQYANVVLLANGVGPQGTITGPQSSTTSSQTSIPSLLSEGSGAKINVVAVGEGKEERWR